MKIFAIVCLLCAVTAPASFAQITLEPEPPTQSQQDAQPQPRPVAPNQPPFGSPHQGAPGLQKQKKHQNRKDYHKKSIVFSALLLLTLASIPVSIIYTGRRLEKVLQNRDNLEEQSRPVKPAESDNI